MLRLSTRTRPFRPTRLMSTIITPATATSPSHRAALMAAEVANAGLQLPSAPQTQLNPEAIPVFTDLRSLREWRTRAFRDGKSVGFVATMGALHEGHMSLVQRSLQENDLTILSIFVNPAQFAPHEDLATYPRTLETDLALLSRESYTSSASPHQIRRTPSAVFVPAVREMYPSGIVQDVGNQKGTFVEVKGYGDQMEGRSRPTFFRGVATVVVKLFNAVQPSNTYFGQKDIQQALLLRRMVRDLLMTHPTPQNLHIVPTHRSSLDHLAMSSRNAYLSPAERLFAPTLFNALTEAKLAWEEGHVRAECVKRASEVVNRAGLDAARRGVEMRLDYVEMNDPESFGVVREDLTVGDHDGKGVVVLSGAMWVGKTRLIDNLLLGDCSKLLS